MDEEDNAEKTSTVDGQWREETRRGMTFSGTIQSLESRELGPRDWKSRVGERGKYGIFIPRQYETRLISNRPFSFYLIISLQNASLWHTISPSHHLTFSPSHHLTLPPFHHTTLQPSHHLTGLLTISPSHHLTISPSHHLTISTSHPPTISPHHPLTLSPSYRPSHHLTISPLHWQATSWVWAENCALFGVCSRFRNDRVTTVLTRKTTGGGKLLTYEPVQVLTLIWGPHRCKKSSLMI